MSTAAAPDLRFYNTLAHRKEVFAPLDPRRVRLYACGPTVYDHLHIGNGRMLIVFDVLFRLLRHTFGADHVAYVRNITDVDDKINARAADRGIDIRQLTDEMTALFHEDAAGLGCLTPTVEPRATDHLQEMAMIIERLVARGHAYVAEEHVLFAVGTMADYGALARRSLDEMIAGARVEVAPYKRNAMDFVLWKPSRPGEPAWPSPAGIATFGRPGWHLECSAMAWKHLGEVFDIHAGGIDLVFPHHENEIAQTRCAFGRATMANLWMHNGHLQVEGEKMSKSLGNFVTIRELWATDRFGGRKWPTEALRLAMLRTHYRQPMDWTVKGLKEAEGTLERWYGAIGDVEPGQQVFPGFLEHLADDLNTPAAIGELHRLASSSLGVGQRLHEPAAKMLKASANKLGLLTQTETQWKQARAAEIAVDIARVQVLLASRSAARAAKRWTESDRIRDELAALGIALKDDKDGTTTWELKR